jgi:hypothetical protein
MISYVRANMPDADCASPSSRYATNGTNGINVVLIKFHASRGVFFICVFVIQLIHEIFDKQNV